MCIISSGCIDYMINKLFICYGNVHVKISPLVNTGVTGIY